MSTCKALLAAFLAAAAPAGILTRLAKCEKTGRLEAIEFEYWIGGGLPPPYYRSDQLRLFTSGDGDRLEFSTLTWDKNFDPPQVQEKFALAARPSDVKDLARLLRETRIFLDRYPEEERPAIADLLSLEILVKAGGHEEKRTYYRSLPNRLAPLRKLIDRLIDLARTEGSKSRYHRGQRIE